MARLLIHQQVPDTPGSRTRWIFDDLCELVELPCGSVRHLTVQHIASRDQNYYSLINFISTLLPNLRTICLGFARLSTEACGIQGHDERGQQEGLFAFFNYVVTHKRIKEFAWIGNDSYYMPPFTKLTNVQTHQLLGVLLGPYSHLRRVILPSCLDLKSDLFASCPLRPWLDTIELLTTYHPDDIDEGIPLIDARIAAYDAEHSRTMTVVLKFRLLAIVVLPSLNPKDLARIWQVEKQTHTTSSIMRISTSQTTSLRWNTGW